jgi:quinoprotein relay system zinc metallohydrolase 2
MDEIAPGVYLHRGAHEETTTHNLGAFANMGFIVGNDGVAVIDTGGSYRAGLRLRESVSRVTDRPVRYVINTHHHPDHAFGNAAFLGDDVNFIGHRRIERALLTRGSFLLRRQQEVLGPAGEGTQIVPPRTIVANTLDVDLGGRVLRVKAWPTAHTDNDLTVLDGQSGILWSGDLVFLERIPVIDGSINGWLDVVAELRRLEARQVVPGHGPVSAWPAALAPMEGYLSALRTEVRGLIANGVSMLKAERMVSQEASERWALFDDYHLRNVMTAYQELEWE